MMSFRNLFRRRSRDGVLLSGAANTFTNCRATRIDGVGPDGCGFLLLPPDEPE